ncbi:hypothetical protein BYT27DRAFT_7196409 [Phlegmacium glaucopus]|nr:hypothetical protein BYT27DRAFT_7196409 [Phlegmacium glaucopus]
MAVARDSSPTPPPPIEACDAEITDPPPPYPSRERRPRSGRSTRGRSGRIQASHADNDVRIPSYPDEDGAREPNETTPFLPALGHHGQHVRHGHHVVTGRPRSYSHTSTISAAPSLAHTVLSLFQVDDEVYLDDGAEDRQLLFPGDDNGSVLSSQSHGTGFFSTAAWKRYFRPLSRKSYYAALFHLMVVNFPYALAAWIYLFIFTVTGITLLVILPLGAILCFFDLLGARAFARGELALQTRFHSPLLVYPTPYPPRPIFTRYREPTIAELETGRPPLTRSGLVCERSFYKNTYAMFTDPTSYQALFYFLVIKPAITLLISLGVLVVGLPLIILILPAPAALRAIRKIGIWQANVAIEGLYLAVR